MRRADRLFRLVETGETFPLEPGRTLDDFLATVETSQGER